MKYFFGTALVVIALLISFFAGAAYQKKADDAASSEPEETSESEETENLPEDTPSSEESSDLVTYTDETYGWSFAYAPEEWTATESTNGSGVTLSSKETTTQYSRDGAPQSMTTIAFSTVKKADFEPIGTKVGNISYDATFDGLVDTSGGEVRCLPLGTPIGKDSRIWTFGYGGSLMSDPAYSYKAVITDQDYMVLIKTYSYEYDASVDALLTTFALSPEVTATFPICGAQ